MITNYDLNEIQEWIDVEIMEYASNTIHSHIVTYMPGRPKNPWLLKKKKLDYFNGWDKISIKIKKCYHVLISSEPPND